MNHIYYANTYANNKLSKYDIFFIFIIHHGDFFLKKIVEVNENECMKQSI
jgi:hypothetical protein